MKHLIITILLFASVVAKADDSKEIDLLAKPILELFKKGDISNVGSKALANSSISDYISKADLVQTDSQFYGYLNVLGEFYSVELIHQQGIEGTFITRWYVLKYKRQPALISLEFYKAKDKWEVHSINLKLELDDYFEERSKIEIGKLGIKES
ncbi:hypothetical protein [Thalassotalea agarivorans]|uniref:DUF3828 domain-containing protein n=1 Tax=Thalassotalea agarivorans TaxID=349064 RepID=A0A1I0GDI2_THASX|nr:hypothetical protein [Thalassotalea agarivorans]SET68921.1 hypothetical protein SAMN05660429_02421 [Thalassotalea agarivorans]